MYKKFFGFKERPFKLVPNPAYLFLSRSHEEALGHLYYAVQQGDGFVEITGEVGTGKTTLCRMFLEKLDAQTEAAFIFNPKLDAIQLLKAINDEFGIASDADNSKDLIDTLNAFLVTKKSEGKKVILLIDEAQNLTREVLEQLRLLSNLETTFSKLIQIILVGQPELGDMLDSHELRQLGQRITLSCHLTPLTFKETREYIRHRIRIASHKPGVKFSNTAFYAIYKHARGIPRLINIVCDRALLTGFSLDKRKITRRIVYSAIKELAGRRVYQTSGLGQEKRLITFLFVLCIVLFAAIIFPPRTSEMADLLRRFNIKRQTPVLSEAQNTMRSESAPQQAAEPSQPVIKKEEEKSSQGAPDPLHTGLPTEPFAQTEPVPIQKEAPDIPESGSDPAAETFTEPAPSLGEVVVGLDTAASRFAAITRLLKIWQTGSGLKHFLRDVESDFEFFRQASKQGGLDVNRIDATMDVIKGINIPVILRLTAPNDPTPKYLAVTRVTDDTVFFSLDDTLLSVGYEELSLYWKGVSYVVWKNFFNYTGTIPLNAPGDSILTLKMHLQEIGFDNIEITPEYDEATLLAVMTIQKQNQLPVDGVVGPLTKIALYNEMKTLPIPVILQDGPGQEEGRGDSDSGDAM